MISSGPFFDDDSAICYKAMRQEVIVDYLLNLFLFSISHRRQVVIRYLTYSNNSTRFIYILYAMNIF